ncbi:hypothetical protein RJ641_033751 [Dillenia turbinata]|uniref:Uncharacterized protein n=1 Tax=Dillenia turbinata TaxID=194707 RepID=A0AAN8ZG28_9MAGN
MKVEVQEETVGVNVEPEKCKEKDLDNCSRCKNAEERCLMLNYEIKKKKGECEALEGKVKALEAEKKSIVDELDKLKMLNCELEERVGREEVKEKKRDGRDGVDGKWEDFEEDKVLQLMVENKVLECERRIAECKAAEWEKKYKDLEGRIIRLEQDAFVPKERRRKDVDSPVKVGIEKRSEATNGSVLGRGLDGGEHKVGMAGCDERVLASEGGTPLCTPRVSSFVDKENVGLHLTKGVNCGKHVKKKLKFEEDSCRNRRMAPATPAAPKCASVSIIEIDDSDDEPEGIQVQIPMSNSKGGNMNFIDDNQALNGDASISKDVTFGDCSIKNPLVQADSEYVEGFWEDAPIPTIATPRRKRALNVVASDTETEEDDNIPIGKLLKKHNHFKKKKCDYDVLTAATPSRRRLVKLGQCKQNGGSKQNSSSKMDASASIPTDHDPEEEVDSDGESSLSGFIVGSSNSSESDDASSEPVGDSECRDTSSESEDALDSIMTYKKVISRIRRSKNQISGWEFEADMLSAFEKDPELCMRAVCALYRRQTQEEQSVKGTLFQNRRGFSKLDAHRGSTLAEFLTDGDPTGDIKKSMKELQHFDPKGPELCRKLATHYSKQLFEIYKSQEDPFFCPS